MGRYVGPSCRLCRRESVKLFLKGIKCYTPKCPLEKRAYPPGQHGQGRVRLSDYGVQLREKQKAKRIYGVLEGQFRRYFHLAQKSRGVTGQQLLEQLERRLDNVLFRMGFATSRGEGRHLVRHRAMTVNGRPMDIPSYAVQVGDVIQAAQGADGLGVYSAAMIGMIWAVAFDWADGLVARRMKGRIGEDRIFGGQLDLLIDIVSYGPHPWTPSWLCSSPAETAAWESTRS